MQKKLIALAVAGLTSVPAFAADSAVTLYGIVDMGYSWRGDNYVDGVKSRSGFDSGQLSGTRLGVRGYEDLGNNLKAIFTLEAGIAADTGGSTQGGLAWGRQTWAGLDWQGNKLTLGRQYTPQFNMYAVYEPFGLGSVAEINNIFTHIQPRADNSLAVSTPFFNVADKLGLAIEGMYSLDVAGNESGQDVGTPPVLANVDTRYGSIFPKVKFGPATAMAGYTQWKVKGGEKSNSAIDVGLNLDFEVVKLFGAYARYNVGANALGTAVYGPDGDKWKFNRYFLGGNVPLGNFNLLASYSYSKDTNDADLKTQQWGVGGLYNMSKRTSLYAVYSKILTTDNVDALYDPLAAANPFSPSVGDASNAGAGYRGGFNLGLRHTF